MRLFHIRPAKKLDPELRKTFERYGPVGMQIALNDMNNFVHHGQPMKASTVLDSVLDWLTEQSDKADKKANWSLLMEIAITVLVFFELVVSLWNLARC